MQCPIGRAFLALGSTGVRALRWEWAGCVGRAERRPVWLAGVSEIEMGAEAGEEGRAQVM